MKSFTGKFTSVSGWAPLLALLLGAGVMISACGDEDVPTPTTPTPTTPTPTPDPDPDPVSTAPTGLRISASGLDYLEWTWNAVEGADGYLAQFSLTDSFTETDPVFPKIGAAQTSHRIENLAAATAGYLRVRSYIGTLAEGELSAWSDRVTGTTSAAPDPVPLNQPANFRSTDRDDNAITLEWDAVADADHYEVEQAIASSDAWSDASCSDGDNEVDDEACEATGLNEATDYDFRVRAIPADSDGDSSAGSWIVTGTAISTTGTSPTTIVTGGEDDLNLSWESDATSITWIWDQVEDRTRTYQTYYVEQAYDPGEDPCRVATTDALWSTGGFATRSVQTTDLVVGDVALLCVQTAWVDDRGADQYGNLSWAWAAMPPVQLTAPVAAETDDTTTRVTTSLNWPIQLDDGFEYRVRIPSVPVGEDLPACDEGTEGTTLTSRSGLNDVTYTYFVQDPSSYTAYGLCVLAANDVGESQWLALDRLSTLPIAPAPPTYMAALGNVVTTGSGSDATHVITKLGWSVAANDAQLPGDEADYTAKVVRSTNDSVTAAEIDGVCTASSNDSTDLATVSTDNTISGINITVEDTDLFSGAASGPHNFYACFRAKLPAADRTATTNHGPWSISSRQVFVKQP